MESATNEKGGCRMKKFLSIVGGMFLLFVLS